jgi:hypothetical protein
MIDVNKEAKTHHYIMTALVVIGIVVVFNKVTHGNMAPVSEQVGVDITALAVMGG